MVPHFLFVLASGAIWVGIDPNVMPAGTILATYRISASPALQQIGVLSGNAGAYACSGGLTTSKHDASKEIH